TSSWSTSWRAPPMDSAPSVGDPVVGLECIYDRGVCQESPCFFALFPFPIPKFGYTIDLVKHVHVGCVDGIDPRHGGRSFRFGRFIGIPRPRRPTKSGKGATHERRVKGPGSAVCIEVAGMANATEE